MTKEEKQLLLKDLCGRLPYKTKVLFSIIYNDEPEELSLTILRCLECIPLEQDDIVIKPYLRTMSSMTEKEKKEYTSYVFEQPFLQQDKTPNLGSVPMCIDWLLIHHFDFRGLIKKGLALEAPEGMYEKF